VLATQERVTDAGSMVNVIVELAPAYDAVSWTWVGLVTMLAVTVKPAESEASGTVTVAGKLIAPLVLASETEAPPGGAGPVSSIVPVAVWSVANEPGLTETPERLIGAGLTVTTPVDQTPE
jgi:hypothetical protein